MRAPGAPVGFLLFFVLVNMYFFFRLLGGGDMCREGGFQKSIRKKKIIITLCLLRSLLGLPFCDRWV